MLQLSLAPVSGWCALPTRLTAPGTLRQPLFLCDSRFRVTAVDLGIRLADRVKHSAQVPVLARPLDPIDHNTSTRGGAIRV